MNAPGIDFRPAGSGGSNAGDAPDELPTEEPSGKEEEDTTDEEKALQSFLQSNEVITVVAALVADANRC